MPPELANFYNSTRNARKIIVVDLGFLGDSVHLVPALWELKRHYPLAALQVLTSPVGCEILALAPCASRTWPVELAPHRRSLRQQWATLRALRRERFDAAFNFSGADRSILMTALTGAPWRVAHAAGRHHFWNRWAIPCWIPRQDPNLTAFEQKRRALAACGLTLEPARFDLHVPESAARWAAAEVPQPAIHLSINSSKSLKEWPLKHSIALVQSLLAEDESLTLIATGTNHPREQQRLSELNAAVAHPRLKAFAGSLTVAQLAAALQRCRLHIGPDSGVIHLAQALGIPTIAFFREQPGYQAWIPVGPQHHVLTQPCTCVDSQAPTCQRLGYAQCLARIAPGDVAALARKRMQVSPHPAAEASPTGNTAASSTPGPAPSQPGSSRGPPGPPT